MQNAVGAVWVLIVVVLGGCAAGERGVGGVERGFLFRTISAEGREFRYAVYVPRAYDPRRSWPVVVFFNGSGECGTDGQKQLAVGLGPALNAHPERWPCVVIFPQKPEVSAAWEDYDGMVMAMLDAAEREWNIDKSREALTGLSQGGHGTWTIAARHPERFAAIAPVCGYGDPAALAPRLRGVPVWAFHGEEDHVVPPEQSRAMAAAIERAGGDVRLTLYPGVGHNSWEKAYAEDALPRWLLRRGVAPPK